MKSSTHPKNQLIGNRERSVQFSFQHVDGLLQLAGVFEHAVNLAALLLDAGNYLEDPLGVHGPIRVTVARPEGCSEPLNLR